MLVLEGMQAGVSWNLVLNKEDNFRKAFDGFDPHIVATYDDAKLEELMQDAGIIRNRQKLKAAITNAQAFLKVQETFIPRFKSGCRLHRKTVEITGLSGFQPFSLFSKIRFSG